MNGDGIFGDAVGATPTLTWAQLAALGIEPRATPYLIRVTVSDGYRQVTSTPVTLTVLPQIQSITWTRDTTAPVSHVLALPAKESGLSFTVTVAATDPGPGASGVAYDAIYVSDDGHKFELWTTVPASSPSAVFTGKRGHTYAFKSVAHDVAGNVEPMPAKIEAKTTIPRVTVAKTRKKTSVALASTSSERIQPSIVGVAAERHKLSRAAGAPRLYAHPAISHPLR